MSTPKARPGRPRPTAGQADPGPPPAGSPSPTGLSGGPKARPGGSGGGRPGAGNGASGKGGPGKAGTGKGAAARGGRGRAVPAPPGPGLVVGPVPVLARVAGGVALAAALLRLVAPAFPLARSGGRDLGGAGNVLDFVPALPLAGVVAVAGLLCLRGRLPRLGLAVLLSAGALAAGLLLRTLALVDTGASSTVDLPLGIGTSARYEVGAGLVLLALGYGLLVAAALLAAAAWPRTLMEDGGDLDPRRPRLAAWGLAVGVLTALVLGMSPYSSGTTLAPPSVPERAGLDLLGGLVLALGAAIWAVLAATLRPWLAVVGAYAGLAAVLLTEALSVLLLVARSPALEASAGGVGTLLSGLAVVALAWTTAPVRGLPRRPS